MFLHLSTEQTQVLSIHYHKKGYVIQQDIISQTPTLTHSKRVTLSLNCLWACKLLQSPWKTVFHNLVDIKEYCDDIVCFYSDNDPYVSYDVEKSFADTISNEQIVIKNGGHINDESGYTKFDSILKYI